MKKNVFGLLLIMLISLFTSQANAAKVTLDWQLEGVTYGSTKCYIEDWESLQAIFVNATTAETNGFDILIRSEVLPEGKTIEDVKVLWNGSDITNFYNSVGWYTCTVTADADATLTVKWAETTEGENPGGESPVYCTYEGNNTHTGRAFNSLTVTGGNADFTISKYVGNGDAVYQDCTDNVLTAAPGSVLNFSAAWSGKWMHGYLYIDYDSDGEFYVQLEDDGTPSLTSELVSYTFYSPTDGATGKNSAGEDVQNDGGVGNNFPAFTVPDNLAPGSYRARFIIDWNNVDPCGIHADGKNQLTTNGGIMLDFTLTVAEAVAPASYAVNVEAVDGIEYQLTYYTSPEDEGTDFYAGEAVPAGAEVWVVLYDVEDSQEVNVTWNGEAATRYTESNVYHTYFFTVNEEGTLKLEMVQTPPATDGYIYRETDMEFTISDTPKAPAYVPEAEAAEIINADNLTIAIEYSLAPENVIGTGNSYGLALTSASDLNAGDVWATAAIISWGTGNNGMTYRYNENGGQYSHGGYTYTGENVRLVYVLTADGFQYYLNGQLVKNGTGVDLRYKTIVPTANSVQIGGCETAWSYMYPFNGTIHSITYYNKGDKDLTAEQFDALFPADEPETTDPKTFLITNIDPEVGEVEKLDVFTVTLHNPALEDDYIYAHNAGETITLTTADGTHITNAQIRYHGGLDATLTLNEVVTTPGTYVLNIPEAFFFNKLVDPSAEDLGVSEGCVYNPAYTFTYTVVESEVDPGQPEQPGEAFNKDGWTVSASSWCWDNNPTNTLGHFDQIKDGDVSNFWHSNWSTADEEHGSTRNNVGLTLDVVPEYLIIDLGEVKENIGGFGYIGRNENGAAVGNGALKDYKIFVSEEPFAVAAPAATDELKSEALALTGEVAAGTFEQSAEELRAYTAEAVKGRYVLVLWLSSYGNPSDRFANCAEFNIYAFDPLVGIEGATTITVSTNDVYTLSGVKLGKVKMDELPAGIYIVNGKKVIVK